MGIATPSLCDGHQLINAVVCYTAEYLGNASWPTELERPVVVWIEF